MIGGFYFVIIFLVGILVIELYIEKVGRKYEFEFGCVRFWGLIGVVVVVVFGGWMFNINFDINFWIVLGLGIFLLFVIFFIKVEVFIIEEKKVKFFFV